MYKTGDLPKVIRCMFLQHLYSHFVHPIGMRSLSSRRGNAKTALANHRESPRPEHFVLIDHKVLLVHFPRVSRPEGICRIIRPNKDEAYGVVAFVLKFGAMTGITGNRGTILARLNEPQLGKKPRRTARQMQHTNAVSIMTDTQIMAAIAPKTSH